uniref:Periphilin 1 n=1 Tax=Suricata suricatta TaxID=37032 RepID=A0A673UPA2_SURSU
MAYRRDEMWSEGRYDYERLPRERVPPRSHPSDGYHRVVNIVPKKPPLLDRPGEGSYNRYYSHVDYRDYDEGRSFSHDRRSGPPHRGDESGYRWTRDDHSISRQPEYRDVRDGFRRKSFCSSHYARDRSPHKRDTPFLRESPGGRRDSPHSRSGSSVSSRSYSPERSKTYSFHQSQHRKSIRAGASYKRQNEGNPERGKERPVQSLKTSRDTSPSSSSAVSSSKVLDKPSRLTEKELAEAASKWAAEKLEKTDENNLPEISEYEGEECWCPKLCWDQTLQATLVSLISLCHGQAKLYFPNLATFLNPSPCTLMLLPEMRCNPAGGWLTSLDRVAGGSCFSWRPWGPRKNVPARWDRLFSLCAAVIYGVTISFSVPGR